MNRNLTKYTLVLLIAVGFVVAQGIMPAMLNEGCVNSLKPMYQGNCSSDYAVVAATVVQLGFCLKAPTVADLKDIKISAQDIMCKCTACHSTPGNACGGGFVDKALNYLINNGVGGGYPTQKQGIITKPATIKGGPTNYKDC
jgi:hypothetical protein